MTDDFVRLIFSPSGTTKMSRFFSLVFLRSILKMNQTTQLDNSATHQSQNHHWNFQIHAYSLEHTCQYIAARSENLCSFQKCCQTVTLDWSEFLTNRSRGNLDGWFFSSVSKILAFRSQSVLRINLSHGTVFGKLIPVKYDLRCWRGRTGPQEPCSREEDGTRSLPSP